MMVNDMTQTKAQLANFLLMNHGIAKKNMKTIY